MPVLLLQRFDLERDLEKPDEALMDAQRALELLQQAAQPGDILELHRASLPRGRARPGSQRPARTGTLVIPIRRGAS